MWSFNDCGNNMHELNEVDVNKHLDEQAKEGGPCKSQTEQIAKA